MVLAPTDLISYKVSFAKASPGIKDFVELGIEGCNWRSSSVLMGSTK